MELNKYKVQLTTLKRASIAGVKAPHKPILLLSIIDLIDKEVIVSNHVELSDALIRMFEYNWIKYIGDSLLFKPVVGTPFWHLHNESFWTLISHSGIEVTKKKVSGAKYTIGSLRKIVAYAEVDDELFQLFKSEECRTIIRELLIVTYFSDNHPQKNDILPVLITIGISMLPIAS